MLGNAGTYSGISGTYGVAGTFGVGGSSTGSGGSSAGGAHGGSTSTGGSAAVAGSGGSGVAGGTGAQGCAHPQPGDMGLLLQYRPANTNTTADAIQFDLQIDNPDDRMVSIANLTLRYYFNNDLGTPMADIWLSQIKAVNTTTRTVDAPKLTFTPTYMEATFTSTDLLATGESLLLQLHIHNADYMMHDQSMDYSFEPATALMPWCHIVVNEQTALAWGTPPPPS